MSNPQNEQGDPLGGRAFEITVGKIERDFENGVGIKLDDVYKLADAHRELRRALREALRDD